MMIFFLNAEEKVYARYCGRGPEGPDARQSLEGLRYTMQSVLAMHEKAGRSSRRGSTGRRARSDAGERRRQTRRLRALPSGSETLNVELKKRRERIPGAIRPENLGIELETHRGNVVKKVRDKDIRYVSVKGGAGEGDVDRVKGGTTPAADIGLKTGDMLRALNGIPIHSFADVQFALDKAPRSGAIDVAWERSGETMSAKLPLPEGWRRSSLVWRPSRRVWSSALSGDDLEPPREPRRWPLRCASPSVKGDGRHGGEGGGHQGGDIIVGIDGKEPEMDMLAFNRYADELPGGEKVHSDVTGSARRRR